MLTHTLPTRAYLLLTSPFAAAQFVYFLKDSNHFVTRNNISELVQFGVLKGSSGSSGMASTSTKAGGSSSSNNASIASSMEPLLRLMGCVYLPQVAHSGSWPDAVRKDFLSYTHRFMSSLTEAVHEAQGRTVLYMPAEELADVSTHEAARDRHLTQRLETTLMYWTRQIADVLNKQDCSDMGQRAGPLVEIEFWRSRSQDLNGIGGQLEHKQVC
jgi:dynein heavy chain